MSSNAGGNSISALLRPLLDNWKRARPQTAIITSSALIASVALYWLARDYQRWKAMGPGGAPANLRGYLWVLGLEAALAKRDTLSLDVYDHPEKTTPGWKEASPAERAAATETSFLKERLPQRKGPRARAKRFVIPQREKNPDEVMVDGLREAYLAMMEQLADTNADRVEWRTSVLELRGRAMFLQPSIPVPRLATRGDGEICHVHTSDLSGHVTLSFPDAKQVIVQGWGERHRLSGGILQLGYTMTFVPRTMEEIEVFRAIFQAGIDYMC